MFEKLQNIKEKYDSISERLQSPEVVMNQNLFRDLSKEYKTLTPIVEAYNRYLETVESMREASDILDDPDSDHDFRELAQAEYDTALEQKGKLEDELKILLLPKDENDDRNVIMEIRAGAGGEEAALFAASMNWKVEVMNENETELGGFKEISFLISGNGAYSKLKYESGVHRVQRVPETEAQGRIQTSTVTVATLPEADEVELEINPKDLQIDTYRSSGAGGQHVNKTESAIRITHIPTGLVVECQDERSQYKNKDRAMKILRSRLLDQKRQVGTGDRSERIRTYNFPQGRVTDHRVNLTSYRIENVMNGDLNEFIDALAAMDQAEKLQSSVD